MSKHLSDSRAQEDKFTLPDILNERNSGLSLMTNNHDASELLKVHLKNTFYRKRSLDGRSGGSTLDQYGKINRYMNSMYISELKSPKAHGSESSLGFQGVNTPSSPFSPAKMKEAEESRMIKINELIDTSAHELTQMIDKRKRYYRDWGFGN